MKIIWSDFALKSFIDIYKYYKEVAGINVAVKKTLYILLLGNN
jgi:plasmid stabilization system protein ParE